MSEAAPLSSKSTFQCLLCDNGAEPCKHFILLSGMILSVLSREPWQGSCINTTTTKGFLLLILVSISEQ